MRDFLYYIAYIVRLFLICDKPLQISKSRKEQKLMGKGKAIAGMILGIVGIVCGCLSGYLSLIGLPVAIVGLCLSVSGGKSLRANNLPAGIATAGLVLGIIATIFTAIAFFTCGICIICASGLASLA